jgi:glycosyltransferase involved in cell wall biosynthesis
LDEPRLISVVFVTYRRLDLLKRTLDSLREWCSYPSLELILADDGSPRKIQEAMRSLPFDRYLFAKKNEGIGT